MTGKSVLLKNGMIVDPQAVTVPPGDIRIENGRIAEIGDTITPRPGEKVINLEGKWVMPGLVDMHVHFDSSPFGHSMLVRAGVTTALSLSDLPDTMLPTAMNHGAGLNAAYLYPLVPGKTISSVSPSPAELDQLVDTALKHGALGIKVLGGHYPVTPTTIAEAVKAARRRHCWVAIHAGSSETPGDVRGMQEALEAADNLPVHMAHINSYCRGLMTGSPLDEAKMAVDLLKQAPNCISESYLALINGTSGRFEGDQPASVVTRRSLVQGGYSPDMAGMEQAILDGWARVHLDNEERRDVTFPPPQEALALYRSRKTMIRLSFPVNSPISAISLALVKNENKEFIVNALATDGGSIPRNVTLHQGLCLVKYGALSLNELAYKASLAPARLMGLTDRGLMVPGAVADLISVNPATSAAELVLAEGRIILNNGSLTGERCRFITTSAGYEFLNSQNIPCLEVNPSWMQ